MVVTNGENGYVRVVSGPITMDVDPPSNRQKADIVLRTSIVPDVIQLPAGEVSFPGEYEIKEVEIRGFQSQESSEKTVRTVYLVKWEDISLVFLGNLREVPEASILKEIAEPDVLVVPVGTGVIEPEAAAKLARQLEPSVVLPTHAKSYDAFSKALGQKAEVVEKFVFKKKELEPKAGKLVILK